MEQTHDDFRPELVKHANIDYCIRADCPRSRRCLLARAYEVAPPFGRHFCVDPRIDTARCPFFRPTEPVRLARGFKASLSTLSRGAMGGMRMALQREFGWTREHTYVVIRGGVPLPPDRQEIIQALGRQFGADIQFETFEEAYL